MSLEMEEIEEELRQALARVLFLSEHVADVERDCSRICHDFSAPMLAPKNYMILAVEALNSRESCSIFEM